MLISNIHIINICNRNQQQFKTWILSFSCGQLCSYASFLRKRYPDPSVGFLVQRTLIIETSFLTYPIQKMGRLFETCFSKLSFESGIFESYALCVWDEIFVKEVSERLRGSEVNLK